ncbi:hypothetical protein [Leuconostoc suionicum]|nr:hypothetical protein [Leuconostoc suionicum]MDC2805185.1 hypothetical protein [Leuconostoc suionicum]MDC2822697.1 hypothetical protein [Leuconostoc suionicum]
MISSSNVYVANIQKRKKENMAFDVKKVQSLSEQSIADLKKI